MCIKIINSGKNPFRIFSVESIDPFSKEKEWVVKGEELKKENSVKSARSSFRDKTARRIVFYRSRQAFEKENPDMVVYYLESVYKFPFSVMPDLIRHPEGLERTGFRLSPE
ncbi:MAG: hypothetical protein FJ106_06130 [Deltaproteobacteria bacterium]|nr:hypothetical protein [Deltaproteobacteria bacterium]